MIIDDFYTHGRTQSVRAPGRTSARSLRVRSRTPPPIAHRRGVFFRDTHRHSGTRATTLCPSTGTGLCRPAGACRHPRPVGAAMWGACVLHGVGTVGSHTRGSRGRGGPARLRAHPHASPRASHGPHGLGPPPTGTSTICRIDFRARFRRVAARSLAPPPRGRYSDVTASRIYTPWAPHNLTCSLAPRTHAI